MKTKKEEFMAYQFFSDGGPEVEEYDSNYLYFNESNTALVSEIVELFARRREDPSVINQLEALCRKSFETTSHQLNVFSALKTSASSYLKKMSNRINWKRPPSFRMKTALSH
jgi:hypothetical protein